MNPERRLDPNYFGDQFVINDVYIYIIQQMPPKVFKRPPRNERSSRSNDS